MLVLNKKFLGNSQAMIILEKVWTRSLSMDTGESMSSIYNIWEISHDFWRVLREYREESIGKTEKRQPTRKEEAQKPEECSIRKEWSAMSQHYPGQQGCFGNKKRGRKGGEGGKERIGDWPLEAGSTMFWVEIGRNRGSEITYFVQPGTWGRGRHNSGKGDKMQFRFFPECPEAFRWKNTIAKSI